MLPSDSPSLQHFLERSCVARAQWCGDGARKLVTRYGVIQRVKWKIWFDLQFKFQRRLYCHTINLQKVSLCHNDLTAFLWKLKRYSLKSVTLQKWKLLEVIKKCHKPFPTIPLFAKMCFNPFDSKPLVTGSSKVCDITKGVLCISTGSLGLQVPVTVIKFSHLVTGYSLLSIPVGNRVS